MLGPGSLYTSLLPNLLVPELVEAIGRSHAPRLYICNLMTQPGETDGLDVSGHLRAIESQLASIGVQQRLFDSVLAQDALPAGPNWLLPIKAPWSVTLMAYTSGLSVLAPKKDSTSEVKDEHLRTTPQPGA